MFAIYHTLYVLSSGMRELMMSSYALRRQRVRVYRVLKNACVVSKPLDLVGRNVNSTLVDLRTVTTCINFNYIHHNCAHIVHIMRMPMLSIIQVVML